MIGKEGKMGERWGAKMAPSLGATDNYPIAPEIHARRGGHHRAIQPVQIRVAEHVQPVPAPANAMLFVIEEAVPRLLIGVGSGVGEECRLFLRRRGQADQIQIDTPKKRQFVRFTRGKQTLGFLALRENSWKCPLAET